MPSNLAMIVYISDRLINRVMVKVLYKNVKRYNLLNGRIFIKFDDPKAVNYRKDIRLWGKFKKCVPITVKTKLHPYIYRNTVLSTYGKTKVSFSHSICNYYP